MKVNGRLIITHNYVRACKSHDQGVLSLAWLFLLCEGNLTWIKDAKNHETNFTYEFNRLKTKTDPLSYIWQYFYDLNGNLDYVKIKGSALENRN